MWKKNVIFIFLIIFNYGNTQECNNVENEEKFNCLPLNQLPITQELCESRNCCWSNDNNNGSTPNCYYPKGYDFGYQIVNVQKYAKGLNVIFQRKQITKKHGNCDTTAPLYPEPVPSIQLNLEILHEALVRVKIDEYNNQRYEALYPKLVPPPDYPVPDPLFDFNFTSGNIDQINPFDFQIFRRSDGTVIFDTSIAPFIFMDQFIEISSKLSSPFIYGLGENPGTFLLNVNNTTRTLFNTDQAPSEYGSQRQSLYGSHPFYLAIEPSGNSHGVLLLNTNAMEIILQPTPSITYRTIGGILDFYIFLGPQPRDVLQQYQTLLGPIEQVPYWAFGFHLCRWGIGTLNNTKEILQRNLDAGVPVEVQWNDLDYMDQRRDFSYDNVNFDGLPEFVDYLHSINLRYIPIVDPAINVNDSYQPFTIGQSYDIFLKNATGDLLLGQVWPDGFSVYPDFTHDNATDYWTDMLQMYHDQVPFDGIWIDMNEPSNFFDGSAYGCDSQYDYPPYLPPLGYSQIFSKTICMDAQQAKGIHYNLHNLYGYTEARATNKAMKTILENRTVIISRSTFAGSGVWGQHWTGDVFSTWDALRYSIPQILNFGLFAMPFIGADICGFNGNTTEELCNRWLQLGAFYPFSRNHNTEDGIDQDPAAFSELVINSTKKALGIRYSLLSYIYTNYMNFYGYEPLARPLFYEFPNDNNTYSIETSFLFGPALLIAPVLDEGATTVDVYLPKTLWYDFYTYELYDGNINSTITLSAPLDQIPILIRSGEILTLQKPEMTTTATKANNIQLIVALNENGGALGQLYWDDGVTRLTKEQQLYTFINMEAAAGQLLIQPTNSYLSLPPLETVTVININRPINVTVNAEQWEFNYEPTNRVLTIANLAVDLNTINTINWGQ